MNNLYSEKTANYPRLKTDKLFADYDNTYKYDGIINKTMNFIENNQLLNPDTWHKFVHQFREKTDFDGGWKGEFWGKMMRGACFVYSCTKKPELYEILKQTVSDMLETQEPSGRISTYSKDTEFKGWDMWCRKYVLLGMQYFMEICTDEEFNKKILASMCRQTDYLIEKIGKAEDGKLPITSASNNWRGLNSSSILEPVVRLFSLTGEQKYLDFAKYIVDCGGTGIANIFNLAYENEFYPYQYPVTKAYEMISCFEGLLEFYRITGVEKYKTAVVNFADKILESDFTVIGSSGCTHELFDHSSVRQANTTNIVLQQETCVTVTLMKFFYQLNLLTGNPTYADAFEISLYNAYLGAVNTELAVSPILEKNYPEVNKEAMPFDSYSPLTEGRRYNSVGGFQKLGDGSYYGCCACIGSAGIGLVPKIQLLSSMNGFAINLFVGGTVKSKLPSGNEICIETKTSYPSDGNVNITLKLQKTESFELLIRNPGWSKNTKISVCGENIKATNGYISINRLWKNGDSVSLELDMRVQAIYPVSYGTDILMTRVWGGADYIVPVFDREDPLNKNHIALRRGPIMLAQDERLGHDLSKPIDLCVQDGYAQTTKYTDNTTLPYEAVVSVNMALNDGNKLTLTDYASAGKSGKTAVWMFT